MLPKPWDSHLKLLMLNAAQDCVSWLVDDAIVDEELSPHLQRHVDADTLYGFHIGASQYVMHLEFQTYRDKNMARRLWEYNVIASCKFKCPVYSTVIFLQKDSVDTLSPYIVRDHRGNEIHHFQFTVVKLWEIPTETLFKKRFKGLLPLAPLTRDGLRREVVERVLAGLVDGNADHDLLLLSYGLTTLAFEKSADLEWVKRRYRMLEEILNNSPAFKEIRKGGAEEGRQEGLQEGLQEELDTLSLFVQARFPTLMPLAKECLPQVVSAEIARQLVRKVGLAQTEEEVKQHLLTALER